LDKTAWDSLYSYDFASVSVSIVHFDTIPSIEILEYKNAHSIEARYSFIHER